MTYKKKTLFVINLITYYALVPQQSSVKKTMSLFVLYSYFFFIVWFKLP